MQTTLRILDDEFTVNNETLKRWTRQHLQLFTNEKITQIPTDAKIE